MSNHVPDGKVNAAGFMSGMVSCIHPEKFLAKASDNLVLQELYFLFHHRAFELYDDIFKIVVWAQVV